MVIEIGGLLSLIMLVLGIWAIIQTLQSNVSSGKKLLWIVLVILLPLLGLILWFFLGPREAHND